LSKVENDSDSAHDSSISMPVPQQRNNPRRNEYVNMPVSHQQTNVWNTNEVERPLPGGGSIASSTSPDVVAHNRMGNQRGHNYANMGFSYMPEPAAAASQNRYSQVIQYLSTVNPGVEVGSVNLELLTPTQKVEKARVQT